MSCRRCRSDGGASAVEFALLLPILVVLIFGIIFGGFAFNTKLTITQAAREGARFGATLAIPGNAAAPSPGDAWFTAVRSRVEQAAFGDQGLVAGDRYICVRFVSEDGTVVQDEFGATAQSSCTVESAGIPANRERVDVVVSRPSRLELILYGFDVQLRSVGVARYEAPVFTGEPATEEDAEGG